MKGKVLTSLEEIYSCYVCSDIVPEVPSVHVEGNRHKFIEATIRH